LKRIRGNIIFSLRYSCKAALAQVFIVLMKPFFMSINLNDPGRNRTSDEGLGNDPALRDDSAAQPGVSTVSDSDTENEESMSVSNDPDTSDFDDDLDDEDFDDDEEDDDDDESI
jgi:hypothetical protein